ncbi:MAG: alkaline phosphatase family protein [Thermoanaerobaculia bacterium]
MTPAGFSKRRAGLVGAFVLLAAALKAAPPTSDFLHWQDAASRSPAPPIPGRRVIVIGWDGADWDLLEPLMRGGLMPNLKALVAEGRTADLVSYPPTVSPMVWTTLATGADPRDHQVLSFFEIDPGTGKPVPISAESRRVPAFWETASAKGQTVGVVNYWATFPAEEVRGFLISDRFSPTLDDPDPGQFASSVYPPAYGAGARSVCEAASHPESSLSHFGDFTGFAPDKIQAFERLLRNTRCAEETAERLYDRDRPQSLTLYFLGTDEVDHLFGRDVAPRLACTPPAEFSRLSRVVPKYYEWVDEFLGRWMGRARRDGATILLVSDHGFKWGANRICGGNPLERQSATFDHRPTGIAAAWGRSVRPSAGRATATVFDVEPTIAALLKIPVDRKEPGKALVDWFSGVEKPLKTNLWAQAPRAKFLPRILPAAPSEYVRQLTSLGYLGGGSGQRAAPLRGSRPTPDEEGWLNLGVYENSIHQPEAAIRSFRKALDVFPAYPPALVNLVADEIRRRNNREAVRWASESLRLSGPGAGWAIYEIADRLDSAGLISDEERLLLEARRKHPGSEPIEVSLAGLRLGQKKCQDSYDALRPFLGSSDNPETYNVAGLASLCLGRGEEGRRLLARSLEIKPDQPQIRKILDQ